MKALKLMIRLNLVVCHFVFKSESVYDSSFKNYLILEITIYIERQFFTVTVTHLHIKFCWDDKYIVNVSNVLVMQQNICRPNQNFAPTVPPSPSFSLKFCQAMTEW